MNTNHISSESLAAYLSRGLPPAEHAAAEAHLADCASCRDEIVRARRLLTNRHRPARIGVLLGVTALAATVLLMVRSPSVDTATTELPDEFRGGPGPTAVPVTAPAEGVTVGDSGIVFRWSSVGTDRLYKVFLSNEAGDRLWSGETTDTSITLPSEHRLQSGATYVWYVDAIGAAGDSATSGPVAFGVR